MKGTESKAPVFLKRHKAWLIRSYQDVHELCRDDRCSSDRISSRSRMIDSNDVTKFDYLLTFLRQWAIFRDGMAHTELRNSMNQGFKPSVIQSMRPSIEGIVETVLDQIQDRTTIDGIVDFAVPIPLRVIGNILGIKKVDHERLFEWSVILASFLGSPQISESLAKRTESVCREMTAYIDLTLREIAASEEISFLKQLAEAPQAQPLQDGVIPSNLVGLLFAGNETTRHLIGNAMHYLLDPEIRRNLKETPENWNPFIEEVLRFDPPIRFFNREATVDFEWNGCSIKKGDRLVMDILEANRDPIVFENPQEFLPERSNNRHLSFGSGAHYCLGATLARQEVLLGLQGLLGRYPHLELAGEARKSENQSFNGYEHIPVRLHR